MTTLPAAAVTATAKTAPLKAARSQDASNEVKPGQDDQGQFQQELTREMNALHGRAETKKQDRNSAEHAESSKDEDDRADTPEPVGSLAPALAAILNGASTFPAIAVDAIPLPAAAATAPDAVPLTQSALSLMANAGTAMASAGNVRAALQELQARAGTAPGQPEIMPLRADAKSDAAANASTRALVESVPAASAAAADSAAAGKIFPDQLNGAAALQTPVNQAAAAAMAAHLSASGRDRVQDERLTRLADRQSAVTASGLELADVDAGQTAFTIGKDKAGSIVAEKVAAEKFLQAGRDPLDLKQGASLETRLVQQHAPETALPAGMNIGAAAPAPAAQAATATIAAHLAAPGWDRGLGEKVMWMAGQKMQVAQLHLNPPELGPLQITLTISNDQASAQFVSQHAAVRDAIETAMPRLREMLAEGGIMLGNTSVSAESFGGQAQAQPDARSYIPRGAAPAETAAEFRSAQAPRATRGLVDIFA